MRLLIKNARVFTARSDSGWKNEIFDPGFILCENANILKVGTEDSFKAEKTDKVVDADGALVTPGFVDCHTHPLFFNHRANEFEMRIAGASYVDIAKAGGGIKFSVRDLRKASSEQLLRACLQRLDRFLAFGTTTIEAKSGYGLSVEDEIRSLETIRVANESHPVDLVPTFLGAHEVPDEFQGRKNEYIAHVIEEMLPRVAEGNLAQFIDVFCENHVFSAEESLRILEAGRASGLRPKIHADQLTNSDGAKVASEVGAVSADHLEHTPAEVDELLLDANVTPVMLPGADFFLNSQTYGPARRMIEAGLNVAVATDFNPGTCMSESMQMMLTLSCLKLKMTPVEAIIAATLNASKAIARDDKIGSLEAGKKADIVIWEAKHEAELPYHFGVNLVNEVYKNGKLAFRKKAMNELANEYEL